MDRTSRRAVLGLAAGLLTGVTACGHRTSHSARAGTHRVDSAKGPITVPARAQRVVCLDLSKIQRMLDLGCRPVGVPTGWNPLPAHRDWYAHAPTLGAQGDISPERVAATGPDLILGTPIGVGDDLYAKLTAIAPTVLLTAPGAGSQWQQLSAADAHAAGRDDRLAVRQEAYRQRIATLRDRHRAALGRLVWAPTYGLPGAAYAFTPTAGMGQLLTDLGARFSGAVRGRSGVAVKLSVETLGRLADADVILTDAQPDGRPTAATAAMLRAPTFRALPAARAHRVFSLSHLLVFSYGEAMALLDQLDPILTRMSAR